VANYIWISRRGPYSSSSFFFFPSSSLATTTAASSINDELLVEASFYFMNPFETAVVHVCVFKI